LLPLEELPGFVGLLLPGAELELPELPGGL